MAAPERAKARNAAWLNLLGTPGLGTWMAGRRVSGLLQLSLAVGGFALVLVWFGQWSFALLHGGRAHPGYRGLGAGLATFALSWCWSLISSLQMLRQSRLHPPTAAPPDRPEPPRLG